MTTGNTALTLHGNIPTAMSIPDVDQLKKLFQSIRAFQAIVRSELKEGHDFGIIPGTTKPTLLKPGAEKIAKLLLLSDQYDILNNVENWDKPLFRYLIKCRLHDIETGKLIAEGLGECNSMEDKYRYRWVSENKLPGGTDKTKLVSEEKTGKNGGKWTAYRLDNDEIYSLVNTILKMAKKRALVDAALSVGRLSELFTQDVEDLADNGKIIDSESVSVDKTTGAIKEDAHFCHVHNTKFYRNEKDGQVWYSHKVKETGKYCNEAQPKQPVVAKEQPEVVKSTPEPTSDQAFDAMPSAAQKPQPEIVIDMSWLKESLMTLDWHDVGKWLNAHFKVTGTKVSEIVASLTPDQQKAFAKEVEDRLAMKG